MDFVGPESYWWLKPKGDPDVSGIERGAAASRAAAQLALQQQNQKFQSQRSMLELSEYLSKKELSNKIQASNSELAGIASKITDFSDPEQMRPIYELGSRAGWIVGTDGWDGVIQSHERAVAAKRMSANAESLITSRTQRAELAKLAEERRALLADASIDLTDRRILDLDDKLALGQAKQALDEKKFSLQQMLGDSRMMVDDARVLNLQNDIRLDERRLAVQEGNLGLRGREIEGKETRLGLRERYLNERNAIDREEKDKLDAAGKASPEADALRKSYNLKRREVTRKFYGPQAGPQEPAPRVPRAGLQPEPDRGTNAPPSFAAPASGDFLPAMPKRKEDLKKDTTYITPLGPAMWDGEKFIPE